MSNSSYSNSSRGSRSITPPRFAKNEKEINVQEYPEDPIDIVEPAHLQQFQQVELEGNKLEVSLLPLYNPVEVGAGLSIPILLQLDVLRGQVKQKRAAIDLMCIVDTSGSMSGQKMTLVQDSLRYIQKILGEDDRISLVEFNSYASLRFGWTRNTLANKASIKKQIKNLNANGGTDIAAGMRLGFQLLKGRKQKNPVSCLFLLSDGQDNNAHLRILSDVEKYEMKENLAIHTFGYGEDHDPKIMDGIATIWQGSFSYVQNIQKVAEHFVLAMSGMLSIYGSDVVVQLLPQPPFQIGKIYGGEGIWFENKLNMNYLIVGQNKQVVFELQVPDEKQNALETVQSVSVKVTGLLINKETEINEQRNLSLTFSKAGGPLNEIVFINLLRAQAAEAIGAAKELAQRQKFDEATQTLENVLRKVSECPFQEQLAFVKNDLEVCKKACQPQEFQRDGMAVMLHRFRHHAQRQRSVSNSGSWNSDEERNMQEFKEGNLKLSESESGGSGDEDNRVGVKRNQGARRSRSNSPIRRKSPMAKEASPRGAQKRTQNRRQSPPFKRSSSEESIGSSSSKERGVRRYSNRRSSKASSQS